MSYMKNSHRAFSTPFFPAFLGLLILMFGVLSFGCTKDKATNGAEPPGDSSAGSAKTDSPTGGRDQAQDQEKDKDKDQKKDKDKDQEKDKDKDKDRYRVEDENKNPEPAGGQPSGSADLPKLVPPGNIEADDPKAKESLVAGENAFTLDLYKRFGKKKGNLFFSPISISTALAMTYAGAAGTTAAEMHKALRLTVDRSKVPATFHAMMKENNPTKKKAGFELSMANRVYINKGYGLKPRFKQTLQQYYAADAEEVNFKKSRATAKKINGWVAKETKGRIKDLVPAQALTELTRLVLANAIYFKGDWKMKFKKKATRPREFYLDGGKRISVDTMHQEAKVRYAATNDVQILEMPYTGDTLSMVIVLPKKRGGLDALEKGFTASKLGGWLSTARERKVKIYLPKFKLKWGGNINGDLRSLGMNAAFSPDTADFRHINPTAKAEGLYISHVFHKAFVEVNEKGTEAAAATAVVMAARGMAKPTTSVFRADHPFMFFIRNKKSGAILFAGRLADPR